MTGPHRGQELFRRSLAMFGAAVALATTSCGSLAGASSPAAAPFTADSVRTAFDNSTMDNAHFNLHGTLIKSGAYYPITGNGVLQRRPVEGLQMNVYLQTFSSAGTVRIQEVTINGRLYSRVGTGKWTSKPTAVSPTALTTYVGEENVDGWRTWHARSGAGRTTYDLWIRESDGYIVQLKYASISGTFTMNFDSYNKSLQIGTPKN
jgi:hypothetical protein